MKKNENFENKEKINQTNSESELELRSNPELWEEVDNLEKEELVTDSRETNRRKNNEQIKIKKPKKINGFKKLFFGVGKEFERVTWTSKKELATSFLITLVVVAFFAIIFTLIGLGLNSNF